MILRKILTLIVAITMPAAPFMRASGPVMSDSVDNAISRLWQTEDLSLTLQQRAVEFNAAAMTFSLPFSLTTLQATGISSRTAATRPAQLGDGELSGSLRADSYHHLTRATTVWGHAEFSAGKVRNVLWNNSADYTLVAPYVIGDPTGGDLTGRSYDFGGGYAGRKAGWLWGLMAGYRAAIDYRGRDPRDKIIVSDLDVSAGGAYIPAHTGFAIGLSGKLRAYSQTASIEFYNPLNDIPTYAMTGLGTYYPRFSGNSGRNTAYSGVGYGFTLSLSPATTQSVSPFYAIIGFDRMSMRQFMRDFNNLELTRTRATTLSFEGGAVRSLTGDVACGLTIKVSHYSKTGTENLLGTSTGNSYPKIGERDNYSLKHTCIALDLPVQLTRGVDRYKGSVSLGWDNLTQKVIDPVRQTAANDIIPGLTGEWSHRFAKGASLTVEAGYSYRFSNPGKIILTGLDTTSPLGEAVLRDIDLMTSDAGSYGIAVNTAIPVTGGGGVTVTASWHRIDMSRRCGSADRFTLTLGFAL